LPKPLPPARSNGIDTDGSRRAIAQRAIEAGHGNDGFAWLTAMLTDRSS
jgi:hypothetical protein